MNIESIKEVEESKLEESRMVSRERSKRNLKDIKQNSGSNLGLTDPSSDHESISDGESPEPMRKKQNRKFPSEVEIGGQ